MIDLRSDTVTQPSDDMRDAAHSAEVGDAVYNEDPTVSKLESRAAEICKTEAALFVPSGTMGNQIAAQVHTERGQEVLCERESHIYKWELGGLVQHAGVQPRTLDGGKRGSITPQQIQDGYVEADRHRPGTGLVALENTHNSKGGTALRPEVIATAASAAHDLDIPVHLDGARLWNAAVAHSVPVSEFVEPVDTVMCCLSKGLGAPIGSLLAGPDSFIEEARRVRKLMGGGMRQAGIIAEPGLCALKNRHRLTEDHRRAEKLAAGIDEISGLTADTPDTNIVVVETDTPAAEVIAAFEADGVLGVPFGDRKIRLCTHWGITDDDIDTVLDVAETVAE